MTNAQMSTRVTDEQGLSLVLKNDAGDYFLVPQETLTGIRVPEDQKAQIEQLIPEQQDVQGYFWQLVGLLHLTPIAVIATGAVLVVREITKD
jgi:hypothetical protein